MVKEEVQTSLQKMLKSRKGISPILATLLLIVIAVAAIIVTYAWVMTFMGAQTTAGGTLLDIENVSWNSTASTTSVVVKNQGTSDAKVVRFYIGNTASNLIEVTASTDLGTGKLLPVDETVTIVLDWPNTLATSWTSGKTYYFKVAPETGASKEFTWKAPSA
jgi:flagellin-like protein